MMSIINQFYTLFVIVTNLIFTVKIGSFHRDACPITNTNYFQSIFIDVYHSTKKDERSTLPEFYTAAVVEYKPIPIGNQTPVQAVLSNVKVYVELMENASKQNVDIIAFPEYGLTTIDLPTQRDLARNYFVDVPTIGSIPCETNHTRILSELSCAAKQYKMYAVVNLGEVKPCEEDDTLEKCPPDGAYHYNTNVVFDRNGAIISRYRKFHLYFEPYYDHPQLEYSTFSTDFGVEFGLFTCFDIIFAQPGVEMVASKGVRNFVFPTAWIDELPFLTAIQAQSLWAQSNKVNLLASGYHQPDRGSMGSGIYSGHHEGALDYVFDSNSGTELVISSVPIFPKVSNGAIRLGKQKLLKKLPNDNNETTHFWLREDLSNCSHKDIDLKSNRESVCYEDIFCCDVEYEITTTPDTLGLMKLIVFDGKRTVAAKRDWFEWQVCAVVHCLNETLDSCSENIHTLSHRPNHFEKLILTMRPIKVEYEMEGVALPALSLLDTSFNLIPQKYFQINHWKDQESGLSYAQAKLKNASDILNVPVKTVAIIQKVYGGRI